MEDIRKRAELMAKLGNINYDAFSNLELKKLIEELNIYQIELQIQNEELRGRKEEIEKARQKYFNLFELAPIGYLILNNKGIILEMNIKASEILGRRKDFSIARPFISFLDKKSMSLFYNIFELAITNNLQESTILEVNKPNDKKYIEVSVSNYMDNEYLISIADITLRQVAEQKLQESEQRYRNFVTNSLDAFTLLDEQGNIIEWNKAQEEISELSKNFVLGKKIWDIQMLLYQHQHKVDEQTLSMIKNRFVGVYMDYFRTGEAEFLNKLIEIPMLTLNNNKKYVQQLTFAIPTDKGYQIGSVSRDITAAKKIDTDMKISEEKYRNLVENVSDGVYYADGKGIFMFVNNAICQLFGYQPEEINGHPAWHLARYDLQNAVKERFIEKLINNDSSYMEIECVTKNGKEIICEINIKRLHNNNYSYGVVRDITIRKNAEQKLLEYKENLEQLNVTKDKLFGIIAHDLKNPFNVIIGFSELILKNIEIYSKEKIWQFVNSMHTSTINTYKLLENLLNWSRLQRGTIGFEPTYINLNNMLEEMIVFFNEQATLKQIKINYFLSARIIIFADTSMISTVIRNLISNAIKFSNPGGQITIFADEQENFVEITISDNGVGISEGQLKYIFDFEKNISRKGTSNESGTGLGLVLCKEFVEKNGGKIFVDTKINEGTDFIFTVPKHKIN